MVTSGFDYLIKTGVADMDAYRAFAGTVLWQRSGVRETHTYAAMEEVKNSTKLHILSGKAQRVASHWSSRPKAT